jgi:hypothetical protein
MTLLARPLSFKANAKEPPINPMPITATVILY